MLARFLVVVGVVALMGVAACSADDDTAEGASASTSTPSTTTSPTSTAPDVRPAVEPVGEVVHGSIETPDGRTRTYRLYLPTERVADAPLVLALHGGSGNGDQFARSSGFDGLAEANGFLVAYAEGTPTALGERRLAWNGGGCCAAAARDDVDDVGFLVALIEMLADEEGIDPTNVVATGHSNGAIMALRMACEAAEQIVAVAGSAGTLFVDECAPTRPVSVLNLHGDDDPNVPIEGGVGDLSVVAADFPPVRDGLAAIAAANGCESAAPTVRDGDRPGVTVEEWGPCPDGVDVELIAVEGAGHDYMDDASLRLWTFLAAHS